jgi:CheY-like chemotaxis protein
VSDEVEMFVMIVDDQKDWIRVNSRRLKREGYSCKGFTDQEAAFIEFKKSPKSFPLVIMDVNLGTNKSGFQLALKMLEVDPSVEIYFVSTGEVFYKYAKELEELANGKGIKFKKKGGDDQGSNIVEILDDLKVSGKIWHSPESKEGAEVSFDYPGAITLWELAGKEEDEDEGEQDAK